MNLIQPGQQDVIIGSTPPFVTLSINSVPSSMIVTSAEKSVVNAYPPNCFIAAAILLVTSVPVGKPNSSPKVF